VDKLDLMGISSVANVLSAIKTAKWFELTSRDVLVTVWTDSMELYESRLQELREAHGEYTSLEAAVDYERYLLGEDIDHMIELSYRERKRVHNLKYYTWVEQQGKTYGEIQDQWYADDYWTGFQRQIDTMDALIEDFNARVGLLPD
jgi:hypothetical protein